MKKRRRPGIPGPRSARNSAISSPPSQPALRATLPPCARPRTWPGRQAPSSGDAAASAIGCDASASHAPESRGAAHWGTFSSVPARIQVAPAIQNGRCNGSGAGSARLPRTVLVDLESHELRVMEGGKVIKTYPAAVGKSETPTPEGEFSVIDVDQNPETNGLGPRWIGFLKDKGRYGDYGHFGIHGNNDPASIGTDASHGCIRLNNDDVKELYSMVGIGTPIRIVGHSPALDQDQTAGPAAPVATDAQSAFDREGTAIQALTHQAPTQQGADHGPSWRDFVPHVFVNPMLEPSKLLPDAKKGENPLLSGLRGFTQGAESLTSPAAIATMIGTAGVGSLGRVGYAIEQGLVKTFTALGVKAAGDKAYTGYQKYQSGDVNGASADWGLGTADGLFAALMARAAYRGKTTVVEDVKQAWNAWRKGGGGEPPPPGAPPGPPTPGNPPSAGGPPAGETPPGAPPENAPTGPLRDVNKATVEEIDQAWEAARKQTPAAPSGARVLKDASFHAYRSSPGAAGEPCHAQAARCRPAQRRLSPIDDITEEDIDQSWEFARKRSPAGPSARPRSPRPRTQISRPPWRSGEMPAVPAAREKAAGREDSAARTRTPIRPLPARRLRTSIRIPARSRSSIPRPGYSTRTSWRRCSIRSSITTTTC